MTAAANTLPKKTANKFLPGFSLQKFLDNHFGMGMPVPPIDANGGIDRASFALSTRIPYTVPYDDTTIITKDDALVTTIKLEGIYADSLNAAQLAAYAATRNTLWGSIADPHLTVYAHLVRRKADIYPEGIPKAYFARIFNEAWKKRFASRPFYLNEIYLTFVVRRAQAGAVGLVGKVLEKFIPPKEDPYEEQKKQMESTIDRALQVLRDYVPRILRIQRLPKFEDFGEDVPRDAVFRALVRFNLKRAAFIERHGDCKTYPKDAVLAHIGPEISEQESFLAYLANLREIRVPITSTPIDKRIAQSRVQTKFIGKFIEVESIGNRRLAAAVSMEAWPEKTSATMLDDLLSVPCEFIMTQSFEFIDRLTADFELTKQKRFLTANDADGTNVEAIDEVRDVQSALRTGTAVDGFHHMSILVHVEAPYEIRTVADKRAAEAQLAEKVSLVNGAFARMGIKAVQEYLAAETFYWSQLPGQNKNLIGRRGNITSENFAGFVSMHNSARGRLDGNLWGPAIMPFPTATGSAYLFNFHKEMEGMVAGHFGCTADTGGGKTALVCAMLAMADKAEPKVFYFDNREGAYVFMMAMGGRHFRLSPVRSTGWNPFQLPDTEENRLFLRDLLVMMREYNGGTVDDDDLARINEAIKQNYSFKDVSERRLRNVAWCFGNGALGTTMRVWYGSGNMAGMFDNETDSIDFSTSRHYCFEQRELIVDGQARKELPLMLSYIMHRITLAMDGRPFIIIADEGQNMVVQRIWQQKIDALIMQIRRKNGIFGFLTPDAKYLYSPVESIKKQSATMVYLPNKNAQKEDYIDRLGLSQTDFEFVQHKAGPRQFLIQRGSERIRAEFDLMPDLKEFIPILSGNEKVTKIMHETIDAEGSEDPEVWLPIVMKRCIEEDTHNLNNAAQTQEKK